MKHKRLNEYIQTLGSILIPIVMVYLGHVYAETEAKQGIHEKYVEIAIEILEEPRKDDHALREWALDILHEYCEIPIHQSTRDHIHVKGLKTTVSE